MKIDFVVLAPAKINLALEVQNYRVDGKHPLKTIMQTLSLSDRLHISAIIGAQRPGISIKMHSLHGLGQDDIPLEENLIYRAIVAFFERVNAPLNYQISIEVDKAIPARSGLGGGSADCAAAIVAAAKILGYDPNSFQAHEVARSLGSDVPFFLEGGCVLLEGFGEQIGAKLSTEPLWICLARPTDGLSTPMVYSSFDSMAGGGLADTEATDADAGAANARPTDTRGTSVGVVNTGTKATDVGEKPANTSKHASKLEALANLLNGPKTQKLDNPDKSNPAIKIQASNKATEIAKLMFNNLEPAAKSLLPEISEMLNVLENSEGVMGAMLSGSGSAVFAICDSEQSANLATKRMRERKWWATTCYTVPFGAGVYD